MADTIKKKRKQGGFGKPFVKGTSGNPHGRPRLDVCVTTWLKQYADIKQSTKLDEKELTYAQAAALKAWQMAAKGELDSYNFIIDRIEGRVPQKIEAKENVNIKYSPEDLSDQELAEIVSSRSGKGIVAPSVGPISSN